MALQTAGLTSGINIFVGPQIQDRVESKYGAFPLMGVHECRWGPQQSWFRTPLQR